MPVYTVSHVDNVRICVVMVGLPARGKSLMSQKIVRYLNWLSISSKSFNVGSYRRRQKQQPTAEFFDENNEEGLDTRNRALEMALKDMLTWFNEKNGTVGVLDASNTTRERRKKILELLRLNKIEPMFLESYCDNNEIIMNNILDVKTTSPDYQGVNPDFAIKDFLKRITKYEQVYEPLNMSTDSDLTFIKLINVNAQIIINKIQTYLESRIVYFIMNLHIKPRTIWLSRHGESSYNLEGKIGGDSDLSERGFKYAKNLPELVSRYIPNNENLEVWTSTLKRTQQTAQYLDYPKKTWKALDELDAGVCDGLTYEEIQKLYPEDFKMRDENKFEYRYRGGESYRDVIIRLEPIIMNLENQENILLITHQAVLRCLYAYFMNVPQEESPWMKIPLHTLIKLDPRAFDTLVTKIKADIPAVSTYKEKGTTKLGEGDDAKFNIAGDIVT
ncbi:hypothetical protein PACTADRAFT_56838 [Pachysolen tannophilus NRRL Y-2460]|uniref:fructose-2,6-bisphosphate 2-phosphatase n=1 Tax=Pachysolen tannophilus NRRL Y-2460 TaxID=669874 RepID=A0A1E4TWI5_PACTA|nr:hypothetical protein PACTADRAFT_56838 [Pachysolen tannophilus NRRL Y-2460]